MTRWLKLLCLAVGAFLAWRVADYAISDASADAPVQSEAVVLSVVDGDTVNVRITIWLDQWIEAPMRVRGIDTPELHGKCKAEITAAIEAKKALAALANGRKVTIYNIDTDKFGRILARVVRDDGVDIGAKMIEAKLARPYNGEKRQGWC